jgi:hypothetical protein
MGQFPLSSTTENAKRAEDAAVGWRIFSYPEKQLMWLRAPPTWFSGLVIVLSGLLIFAVVVCFILSIYYAIFLVFEGLLNLRDFATNGHVNEKKAEAARHIVTVAGTFVGGLVATSLVVWRTWLSQRQTRTGEQQRKIAEGVHLATLYAKAVDQLGTVHQLKGKDSNGDFDRTSPNIAMRVGGLYALEKLALSSDEYKVPVVRAIRNYIESECPKYDLNKEYSSEDAYMTRSDVSVAFEVMINLGNSFFENYPGFFVRDFTIRSIVISNNDEFSDFRALFFRNCAIINCKFHSKSKPWIEFENCQTISTSVSTIYSNYKDNSGKHKNLQLSLVDLKQVVIAKSNFSGGEIYLPRSESIRHFKDLSIMNCKVQIDLLYSYVADIRICNSNLSPMGITNFTQQHLDNIDIFPPPETPEGFRTPEKWQKYQ